MDNTIKKKIGQRILDLRVEKGETQESLARKSDVSLRTIGNIENGNFNLRIDVLEKIADALDCDIRLVKRR